MSAEGITFVPNMDLGKKLKLNKLTSEFDAVILCCGAKKARDLPIKNRSVNGVYFAVDFLTSTTKSLIDSNLLDNNFINAKGKDVVVLGGGDTGNDCVGTAIRHGAKSVVQIEMMPKAPDERLPTNPWPEWPKVCLTDYGQQEAIELFGNDPRVYQTTIKEIIEKDNNIVGIITVEVEFKDGKICEISGTERTLNADLLLIAAGFVGYEEYSAKGIKIPEKLATSYKTDNEGVFACGDMKRGQSLVVWAVADGIKCASEVDSYLGDF